MTEGAARGLARHNGFYISLNGLSQISDSLAGLLSEYSGDGLFLGGLPHLSDGVAEALARFHGMTLGLGGLRHISDSAAQKLSRIGSLALQLDGLETLSTTAAESLAGASDHLDLSGQKCLSAEAANALVKHGFEGQEILLDGLKDLDNDIYGTLMQHPGVISLRGLFE